LNQLRIFIVFIFFFPSLISAQVDSLRRIISSTKEDSVKFRLCNEFSETLSASDNKSAMAFAQMAIAIAEKHSDKKGKSKGMNNFAYALYYTGKSDSAIKILNESIALSREAGDSSNIYWALNRVGFIYREKGDFAKALIAYNQALASNTGEKNKVEAANSYLNIGVIYNDQKNYPDALRYEEKGLKLYTEAGETARIANCYARLGNTYLEMKDTLKATKDYETSLGLFTKANNPRGIAVCLNNIANIYKDKKDIPKALDYYGRAMAMREKIGDKNGVAIICNNMGVLYTGLKDYDKAIELFEKSVQISKDLGFKDQLKDNYSGLSQAYEEKGDDRAALTYYKLYKETYDSLFNEKNNQQINELNAKFDTERQKRDNEELTKENEFQVRKNLFMTAAIGLLLILVRVVWRNARRSKQANVLLQQQKNEISSQKKIVEEQHRDILDSINYAKRIQRAVLPTQEDIHKLFPRSFCFFRPRDIVSGDFWWIGETGSTKLIAVADCTGHGVPGAFMSLIGNTALNEIVKEKHIADPGEILQHLSQYIVTSLKQENNPELMSGVKDGMDISLCAIDETNGVLKFAGANNSLYYVEQGMLKEAKGDRQPVGVFEGLIKPFTVHSLPLKNIDAFYIFSDGFADQFGGPQGKKFKSAQLQELINASWKKTPAEQSEALSTAFYSWKGNLDQVDDVLLMGVLR
jgi:serine phosphatase RsbU (regulator of sigma subunit)